MCNLASASQLASIPYPNLSAAEQRAIAHILGTLDDRIELNRRMNETLEAMVRPDHSVRFLETVHHGFFGQDGPGAVVHRETRLLSPIFRVRTYGDEVRALVRQHLLGVFVDRIDAIALGENGKTLLVPIHSGDEVDFRSIPECLRVGGRVALVPGMLVVVEPAMYVELRRGAAALIISIEASHRRSESRWLWRAA